MVYYVTGVHLSVIHMVVHNNTSGHVQLVLLRNYYSRYCDPVSGDYFGKSGVNSGFNTPDFHPDDPLWDGMGCSANSTCCSFNNPPYFIKQLSNPTTDDIETRICNLNITSAEDSPIEFIELYVQ